MNDSQPKGTAYVLDFDKARKGAPPPIEILSSSESWRRPRFKFPSSFIELHEALVAVRDFTILRSRSVRAVARALVGSAPAPLTVENVRKLTGLSASTVYGHVRRLRTAGLVDSVGREGPIVIVAKPRLIERLRRLERN